MHSYFLYILDLWIYSLVCSFSVENITMWGVIDFVFVALFQYKNHLSRYRDSRYEDKTGVRLSYLNLR